MLLLLTTVVLGTLFAVFATQNTGSTNLNFGGYTLTGVPNYLAILVPLLVGLLISSLVYIMRTLSSNMTIGEQKDEIEKLKKELTEVNKKAHQLELTNAKLKTKVGEFDEDSI